MHICSSNDIITLGLIIVTEDHRISTKMPISDIRNSHFKHGLGKSKKLLHSIAIAVHFECLPEVKSESLLLITLFISDTRPREFELFLI